MAGLAPRVLSPGPPWLWGQEESPARFRVKIYPAGEALPER